MYARRLLKNRNLKWDFVFQPSKYYITPKHKDYMFSRSLCSRTLAGNCSLCDNLIRRYLSDSLLTQGVAAGNSNVRLHGSFNVTLRSSQLRFYSSDGDGRNASEDEHIPVKDGANFDKGKTKRKVREAVRHCDEHIRLGEQDQKEWLNNEKLAIESRKKESPFLSRREKLKNEFLRRVVPWEKITVSWETFPYHIPEHTKNLLVECAASHLKHKKFTVSYGARLTSSSGRILLQSVPGTELYRERLVRALARDLQVPLLVLDSSILASYDFAEGCSSECESDDDNLESCEDCISESEIEDESDSNDEEEWTSSGEVKSDASDNDDVQASAEALKKLVPHKLKKFEQRVAAELEISSESSTSEAVESSDKPKWSLKKGDRVKYVGASIDIEADNRPLSSGQRGEVYEVNGDRVAVILDRSEKNPNEGEEDEKLIDRAEKPSVYWMQVKDIEYDLDTEGEDRYIAMEALCEVLHSTQPLIVYFPDSSQWLLRAVSKPNQKEFVRRVQEMFDQLSGPVVLICGQNKTEAGSKEREKFTMLVPGLGRLAKLPVPLKQLTEGLKATKTSENNEILKLFSNVICIDTPKKF